MIYCGLLKDKDTVILPCEYDKIVHKNGAIYMVTKAGESTDEDVKLYKQ